MSISHSDCSEMERHESFSTSSLFFLFPAALSQCRLFLIHYLNRMAVCNTCGTLKHLWLVPLWLAYDFHGRSTMCLDCALSSTAEEKFGNLVEDSFIWRAAGFQGHASRGAKRAESWSSLQSISAGSCQHTVYNKVMTQWNWLDNFLRAYVS